MELGVSEDMLGRVFDGTGYVRLMSGPEILPDARMDINGLPMNPAARMLPGRVYSDRCICNRRTEHTGSWTEASDLSQHPVCRMHSWQHRLQDRQRYVEQDENFALYSLLWVLLSRSLTSLSKASARQEHLTERTVCQPCK